MMGDAFYRASNADGVVSIGDDLPFWRGECFVVARDGGTDEA